MPLIDIMKVEILFVTMRARSSLSLLGSVVLNHEYARKWQDSNEVEMRPGNLEVRALILSVSAN